MKHCSYTCSFATHVLSQPLFTLTTTLLAALTSFLDLSLAPYSASKSSGKLLLRLSDDKHAGTSAIRPENDLDAVRLLLFDFLGLKGGVWGCRTSRSVLTVHSANPNCVMLGCKVLSHSKCCTAGQIGLMQQRHEAQCIRFLL